MNHQMGICHGDAVLVKDALDVFQHIEVDAPVIRVFDPEAERIFDGVVAVAADAAKTGSMGRTRGSCAALTSAALTFSMSSS